jgi:excinuclease ABC subunit C
MEKRCMVLNFERAAELRDQIALLRRVQDQQTWKAAPATWMWSRPSSTRRRLRAPDQRARRAGAGQQELLQVGIEEEVAEVMAAFLPVLPGQCRARTAGRADRQRGARGFPTISEAIDELRGAS